MSKLDRLQVPTALFFCLFLLAAPARADSQNNDLAFTQAIGAVLEARVAADLLNHDSLNAPRRGDYPMGIRLRGLSALLDWQPAHNGFHLSGGVLYNPGPRSTLAQPNQGVFTTGGRAYATDVMNGLSAGAELHRFSPYLGIGWHHATDSSRRFALGFDLGVIYQESPPPGLDIANPTDSAMGFNGGPFRQGWTLQNSIGGLHLYPVMSLGMGYRF